MILEAVAASTKHKVYYFFFPSRRRHTICLSDWSSDVCSSDLTRPILALLPIVVAAPIWAGTFAGGSAQIGAATTIGSSARIGRVIAVHTAYFLLTRCTLTVSLASMLLLSPSVVRKPRLLSPS